MTKLNKHELIFAKWNETQQQWILETSQGKFLVKTEVFSAGAITEPSVPQIKGSDTFNGAMFHSPRWKHDYDLTGKQVAVTGTGASAIQFIAQLQPDVKELIVFQRTAPDVPQNRSGIE